jgi:FkbM family methyltransferase
MPSRYRFRTARGLRVLANTWLLQSLLLAASVPVYDKKHPDRAIPRSNGAWTGSHPADSHPAVPRGLVTELVQTYNWPTLATSPACMPRLEALHAVGDLKSYAWAEIQGGCDGKKCTQPFTMLVHASGDIVSSSILAHGKWEGDHLEAAEQHHKKRGKTLPMDRWSGKRYLDVGGNIGYFTMLAASKGYEVTTIEAMTQNARMLNMTLCANPMLAHRVDLFNVGVSEKPGKCLIVSGNDNKADGILRCDLAEPSQFKQEGYSVRGVVEIKTLDSMLKGDYFMLKMDIEGHEPMAYRGARRYFEKHEIEYIVTEAHQTDGRPEFFQQLQTLGKRGYSLRVVDYSKPAGRAIVESGAAIDASNRAQMLESSNWPMVDVFCESK